MDIDDTFENDENDGTLLPINELFVKKLSNTEKIPKEEKKEQINSESYYLNNTKKIKKISKNRQLRLFKLIKLLNNHFLLELFKISKNKEKLESIYSDIKNKNLYEDYIEIDNYLSLDKENSENENYNLTIEQKEYILQTIESILKNEKNTNILYLKSELIEFLENNLQKTSQKLKKIESQILSQIKQIKNKKESQKYINKLKSNIYYEINTNNPILNQEIKKLQYNLKDLELESGLDVSTLKVIFKKVFLLKNKIKSYKSKIIESNLPLVIYTVRNYRNKGIEDLDLIQEGNIGLIKAVDKFNLDKGYQFSTYAIWWIKQGVLRTIIENSNMIRIPVYISDSINKLRKYLAENNMSYSDINNTNIDQIADKIKLTKSKILNILQTNNKFVSIYDTNENIKGEKKLSLEEMLTVDEYNIEDLVYQQERLEIIMSLLKNMPKRSAEALVYYYGLGSNKSYSLEEVGSFLNLTKERVRQLNLKTFERLKKNCNKLKL